MSARATAGGAPRRHGLVAPVTSPEEATSGVWGSSRISRALGPARARTRRLPAFVAATAAILTAWLGLADGALAGLIFPESGGSPNADDISLLYEIVFYIAVVVFVVVEGALVYSLIRFRARKGRAAKDQVAAQIHGNTRLEIGWTLGAAVIVIVLATITFIKLSDITDPPASPADGYNAAQEPLYATTDQPNPPGGGGLTIDVNGLQYVWRFTYPNDAYAYEMMVVPVNTTVILRIRSQDVAHSWWIPKLGGKQDAIPGNTNESWFLARKEGLYSGQCAELCGSGHANMFASVCVVSVPEFEAWTRDQKAAIEEANRLAALQRRTFVRPGAPGATPAPDLSGAEASTKDASASFQQPCGAGAA
jgi:cytochrome c oxidase subunit II